jgi:MOSC domain-containing protein YiiM
MSAAGPCVVSINVGAPRETRWRGRLVRSAIWKDPVGDRVVAIRRLNVAGDRQADPTVHGGTDKAVYAYAVEDYRHWTEHEGIATTPGLFGENLTVQGLDLGLALVGDRWHLGSTILEVTQPRLPCFKLGVRMNDPGFPKRFLSVGRLGAYLRVVEEGGIRPGDAIVVSDRWGQGVTMREMAQAMLRGERAPFQL